MEMPVKILDGAILPRRSFERFRQVAAVDMSASLGFEILGILIINGTIAGLPMRQRTFAVREIIWLDLRLSVRAGGDEDAGVFIDALRRRQLVMVIMEINFDNPDHRFAADSLDDLDGIAVIASPRLSGRFDDEFPLAMRTYGFAVVRRTGQR